MKKISPNFSNWMCSIIFGDFRPIFVDSFVKEFVVRPILSTKFGKKGKKGENYIKDRYATGY